MNVAEYFSKFDDSRINDLEVNAPYEQNKDKPSQWVRGTIKYKPTPDSDPRDLVITGPKLKVCFGGCKFNKLVFAIPKEDEECNEETRAFLNWLNKLVTKVKNTIWSSPETFKPGSKANSRFIFDNHIKPASDPKYPNELHCRLSTFKRRMTEAEKNEHSDVLFDPNSDQTDVIDTDIFTMIDGVKEAVEPSTVLPRSFMRPVIRFAYTRHGDNFNLVLTITKVQYFASENQQYRVQNADWVMDIPEETEEPELKRAKTIKQNDNSP